MPSRESYMSWWIMVWLTLQSTLRHLCRHESSWEFHRMAVVRATGGQGGQSDLIKGRPAVLGNVPEFMETFALPMNHMMESGCDKCTGECSGGTEEEWWIEVLISKESTEMGQNSAARSDIITDELMFLAKSTQTWTGISLKLKILRKLNQPHIKNQPKKPPL